MVDQLNRHVRQHDLFKRDGEMDGFDKEICALQYFCCSISSTVFITPNRKVCNVQVR